MSKAHGQLGWIAHHRIEPLGVMPKTPPDHPSRVYSRADRDAFRGLFIQGWELAQALVQRQRREHRAPRMILLGQGCAKHDRESVTGLVDERALILLQNLLDESEHRLHAAIHDLQSQAGHQGRHSS
jgi:hypothetical protein